MAQSSFPYPITNKYTFAQVFSKPENVRPLLEEVMGVPIGSISVAEPEHVVEASLRGRGVRMDVFADDGSGTIYDVEMQNVNEGDLTLRTRYLLSSFDRDRIQRGEAYQNLGKTVVIFICAFDPIGLGERVYEVRPTILGCDKVFDDGTARFFLNAQGASAEDDGARGGETHRLAAFLSYVDGGGTMGDEWVTQLDREVAALNADEGWRDTMLGIELDHMSDIYYAKKQGREEGLAEGREEGLAEGREEGREEGRKEIADRLARLAKVLIAEGRESELAQAALDPEALEQLYVRYGIS